MRWVSVCLKLTLFMKRGSILVKHAYRDVKGRSQKQVQLSADGTEICWGDLGSKKLSKKQNVSEALGIIYGARTSTFERRSKILDNEWMCFSIIFTNRTLDFSALDDEVLKNWFLGLQGCICKDKDEVYR